MELSKVLIYDSKGCFSRLLSAEFSDEYVFVVNKNFDRDYVFEEYSMIIYVVYSCVELIDLFKVYDKKLPLLLCSFEREVYNKAKHIDGVIPVDLTKHKFEILWDFKNYFDVVNKSYIIINK
ncbi:hypothetical protein OOZ15_18655 [Galbibacter sp. EGI 63066]|uniref:hypothetical protein n=1 Tax=Galbibacter sp. EGI 63066 TaxID=2993559 RepID=UPI0022498F34|nr:hypothetical protein [Galbibacter sp. EGI 63066]MCX2681979.1 hypothetical protein [Galbibacter sp. EGI 63066]